jgi:hypothetical protein
MMGRAVDTGGRGHVDMPGNWRSQGGALFGEIAASGRCDSRTFGRRRNHFVDVTEMVPMDGNAGRITSQPSTWGTNDRQLRLKDYQERTLGRAAARIFRRVRAAGQRGEGVCGAAARRGTPRWRRRHNHTPTEELAGLPYVCLRLPTGAGKTLLAAHTPASRGGIFCGRTPVWCSGWSRRTPSAARTSTR